MNQPNPGNNLFVLNSDGGRVTLKTPSVLTPELWEKLNQCVRAMKPDSDARPLPIPHCRGEPLSIITPSSATGDGTEYLYNGTLRRAATGGAPEKI